MRIGDHFGNPGLTASEREHLAETQALLDQVEARWDAIVRGCAGLPETVVHGDFRPKNVRIRTGAGGPTLYALDWELAGWGIPVVDLAPGRGAAGILQIDPGIYADELRGHGPSLDGEAIERLSLIGFMLRRLAAIDWESLSLHFQDPRYLSDPTASIQVAHQELARGLARAESWLRRRRTWSAYSQRADSRRSPNSARRCNRRWRRMPPSQASRSTRSSRASTGCGSRSGA